MELLDLQYNPKTGLWDIYLGSWLIYRGLTLTKALVTAGYRVVEA